MTTAEAWDKNYSAEERKKMSESGEAMPDGSYPIANGSDLSNAIQAYGRASNQATVKRHIVRRARALGETSKLPADWNVKDQSSIHANETIVLDAAEVRTTGDGYMVATPRVARSGIQIYRGYELGKPGMDTVRVYRPADEVFDGASLHSYAHRPLTNDHPPVMVTSDNWKQYSVGQTGDSVMRDGEFVRVPMMLMDKTAINDYKAGKKELSLGYTMDLSWEAGETNDGQKYDAVMSGIRANHLAVVTAARGGSKLRIGDNHSAHKEKHMKTIVLDGLSVQVEDRDAEIIDRHVKGLEAKLQTSTAQLTTLQTTSDGKVAELTTELKKVTDASAAKDAEIVTLKKQVEDGKITPAKLDELVKDRAQVVGKARAILGDKLVVDGKSLSEIQSQVVSGKLGDAAKGWTEAQIAASFNTLTADVKVQPAKDALTTTLSHGVRSTDGKGVVEESYGAYDKGLQEAWKTPARAN